MNAVKTALVTGSNKGIGFEVVRQLAEAGLHVVLAARDAARGEEAAASLRERGLDVRFAQLDVRDSESIARVADSLANEEGGLDLLVNNAGIASRNDGAPGAVSLEVIRDALETNFIGAVAVTQAMLPLLVESAGRVVNVSSETVAGFFYAERDFPPDYFRPLFTVP